MSGFLALQMLIGTKTQPNSLSTGKNYPLMPQRSFLRKDFKAFGRAIYRKTLEMIPINVSILPFYDQFM